MGASAGGLQALQSFLTNVPAGSSLAYVVVQHLDPAHKAALTELLARVCLMPVLEANYLDKHAAVNRTAAALTAAGVAVKPAALLHVRAGERSATAA